MDNHSKFSVDGNYSKKLEFRVLHVIGVGYVPTVRSSEGYPVADYPPSEQEPKNEGWDYILYSDDGKHLRNWSCLGEHKLLKTRSQAIKLANEYAVANKLTYPFIVEWDTKSEKPTKGTSSFEKFAGKLIGDAEEAAELFGEESS